MGFIKEAYKYICKRDNILLEARGKGLLYRLDEFFFDPKTQTYNQEFRERLTKERENFLNKVNNSNAKEDTREKFMANMEITVIIYCLLHPIRVGKINKMYEKI